MQLIRTMALGKESCMGMSHRTFQEHIWGYISSPKSSKKYIYFEKYFFDQFLFLLIRGAIYYIFYFKLYYLLEYCNAQKSQSYCCNAKKIISKGEYYSNEIMRMTIKNIGNFKNKTNGNEKERYNNSVTKYIKCLIYNNHKIRDLNGLKKGSIFIFKLLKCLENLNGPKTIYIYI